LDRQLQLQWQGGLWVPLGAIVLDPSESSR
jgi:hypothetical protein